MSTPSGDLINEGATRFAGSDQYLAPTLGTRPTFDPSTCYHPVDRSTERRRVRAHPFGQASHSKRAGARQHYEHAKLWKRDELERRRNRPSDNTQQRTRYRQDRFCGLGPESGRVAHNSPLQRLTYLCTQAIVARLHLRGASRAGSARSAKHPHCRSWTCSGPRGSRRLRAIRGSPLVERMLESGTRRGRRRCAGLRLAAQDRQCHRRIDCRRCPGRGGAAMNAAGAARAGLPRESDLIAGESTIYQIVDGRRPGLADFVRHGEGGGAIAGVGSHCHASADQRAGCGRRSNDLPRGKSRNNLSAIYQPQGAANQCTLGVARCSPPTPPGQPS